MQASKHTCMYTNKKCGATHVPGLAVTSRCGVLLCCQAQMLALHRQGAARAYKKVTACLCYVHGGNNIEAPKDPIKD